MALLSMALHEQGVPAISFTGSQSGIITNDAHAQARIVEVRPFRIQDELERGKVVIVAGYQGVSRKREVTTLGRGGIDTTAVALAAALGAEACEIYSDVDGVFSADPRVVPDARKLAEAVLRRDAGARGRRGPGPQRPGGGVRAERGHRHRGAQHPRGRHRLAHRSRGGAESGRWRATRRSGSSRWRTPGSSPSSVGSPRTRCACGSWPGAAAGQGGSWWSFRSRTCTGSMRSTRASGTWGPSRARGSGPSPWPARAWGRRARSSPVASGPRPRSASTCAPSTALRCS